MTNKAYIVANKQQEHVVLWNLEREGLTWNYSMKKMTQVIPSHYPNIVNFPYSLKVFGSSVIWDWVDEVEDYEIVYDGRKEEQMSEKYVVSQEFMNELEEWKDRLPSSGYKHKPFVGWINIKNLPETLLMWWGGDGFTDEENNNRLIAIIRWVNGEDVFEVKKPKNPKKWVVRSKKTDSTYCYAQLLSENNNTLFMGYSFANATRFDTKEEAESWANTHQEVIEVEE